MRWNCILKKYGFSKNEAVVIGDRLYTDIATGVNSGITSICVLSGEATLAQIKSGSIKPSFIFNSIKDLVY